MEVHYMRPRRGIAFKAARIGAVVAVLCLAAAQARTLVFDTRGMTAREAISLLRTPTSEETRQCLVAAVRRDLAETVEMLVAEAKFDCPSSQEARVAIKQVRDILAR